MKKSEIKLILGTMVVLGALGNSYASAKISKKNKKHHEKLSIIYKINDKTNDQSSVSDGSKTESNGK